MKTTLKISAAVLAGLLSVGVLTSTAEASPAPLVQCRVSSGQSATFGAYYNVGSNGRPAFWGFAWNLTSSPLDPIRNKNNVSITIQESVPYEFDQAIWYWISPDSIRAGASLIRLSTPFQVKTTNRVHIDAKFTFDLTNFPDSRCTAHTPNV